MLVFALMIDSGVRSSWEASAVNRRWRRLSHETHQ